MCSVCAFNIFLGEGQLDNTVPLYVNKENNKGQHVDMLGVIAILVWGEPD